jgi:hypothetical protein
VLGSLAKVLAKLKKKEGSAESGALLLLNEIQ